MRHKTHLYETTVVWTGNLGRGTPSYSGYSRDHEISAPGKRLPVAGSSDPAFRGDVTRYNPEELLVSALSACHMLWVLHLCAEAGVTVLSYEDRANGAMVEMPDGGGQFTRVTLRPRMVITAESDLQKAELAHDRAHELCFLARSVNFPVYHEPEVSTAASPVDS
ncbi:MAG: OsmC family protein [Verrucomicrobia bacterium]|nr:OsmC family protein [Verrucomicrobiota bacterium]